MISEHISDDIPPQKIFLNMAIAISLLIFYPDCHNSNLQSSVNADGFHCYFPSYHLLMIVAKVILSFMRIG